MGRARQGPVVLQCTQAPMGGVRLVVRAVSSCMGEGNTRLWGGQPGGAARQLELVAGHKFWSPADACESRNGTVRDRWRREQADHNAQECE